MATQRGAAHVPGVSSRSQLVNWPSWSPVGGERQGQEAKPRPGSLDGRQQLVDHTRRLVGMHRRQGPASLPTAPPSLPEGSLLEEDGVASLRVAERVSLRQLSAGGWRLPVRLPQPLALASRSQTERQQPQDTQERHAAEAATAPEGLLHPPPRHESYYLDSQVSNLSFRPAAFAPNLHSRRCRGSRAADRSGPIVDGVRQREEERQKRQQPRQVPQKKSRSPRVSQGRADVGQPSTVTERMAQNWTHNMTSGKRLQIHCHEVCAVRERVVNARFISHRSSGIGMK
ncbi:hypothetical protein EYF80_025500 [Liparis tanakae]|uniref:Uncharacterized protein n=1 Tax=Liparis tanakae TaxID=230148 RepID=A0A4Z2HEI9_9TELE|nr:hypothetical protein EYF80_025500 [Liparis tanakae]